MTHYCKRCDQHIAGPECPVHGGECVLIVAGAFSVKRGAERTEVMGADGKTLYFRRLEQDTKSLAEWRARSGFYASRGRRRKQSLTGG